ncbi:AAA family ATPase [Roseivivax marinus]|uniref:AAA family ATPase n=1 Tax=Roseivivax marinus TaxID=1379903 RepID=UPI001F04C3B6|nr:AAA family ATPase [Roseivivax marinus]UMA66238.1 AAA family ATPase [Roseivivax marinus]
MQIAERYALGENFREISDGLNIAPSTVRTHLAKVYRKLDVSNKVALAEVLRPPVPDVAAEPASSDTVKRVPARRTTATVAYLFVERFAVAAQSASPEDVRDFADAIRRTVADVARAFEAEHLSHGAAAHALVFGFPQAQELDAETAARAAISLRCALSEQSSPDPFGHLAPQIALYTGHVVVPPRRAGAAAPKLEQVVAGLVDIAAEMARKCEPGTVRVCPRTRSAIPVGDFEGDAGSASTAVLIGLREQRFRSGSEGTRAGSRFVGRTLELEMLDELHATCAERFGQTAQIVGDAGIGKSRLIQEFLARIDKAGQRVLVMQCDPLDLVEPFAPVHRMLRTIADPAAPKETAMRALWADTSVAAETLGIAIGEILGDPAIGGDLAARSSPERRRACTFDALDALLWSHAGQALLVVVCEDLHWADPTTLEWLGRLSIVIGNAPIFLLTTSRPRHGAAPLVGSDVATITLRPLTASQSAALIATLPGATELAGDIVDRIVNRSDGVPLFLEELFNASLSLDTAADVPDSLTGALRARFAISGEPITIVEAASVFGQSFEVADVAAILKSDPAEVEDRLTGIRDAKVIMPAFGSGAGQYQFRHALLRDFAYSQLTRDRLAALHARAATVLTKKPGAPALMIAEHLAASGQTADAAGRYLQAAGIAVGRGANREVIDICGRVIALCADLPSVPDRVGTELQSRILMGVAMQALHGYSHPSVLDNYRRAHELCEMAGARTELFPVLRGLYVYNLLAGNLRESHRLALQLTDMAERLGTREHLTEARFALGQITAYHCDEIEDGLSLLREAAELYDGSMSAHHVRSYGQDPGVFSLALSLFPLVAMGRFSEVRQTIRTANDLAERTGHPMSHAAALVFSSWACNAMSDGNQALVFADQACALGRTQLLPSFEFWGEAMRAVALGDVAQVARKLEFYDASGMKFTIVIILPMLAERALDAGEVGTAVDVNRRALDLLATDEAEPCMSAEAYRITARIEAAQGRTEARNALLDKAWSLTEATGARFFGLRTAAQALAFDLPCDPWKGRLAQSTEDISSELPASIRDRANGYLNGDSSHSP